MKHRIKLSDRLLPNYTKGEEIMNMVTHIAGFALSLVVIVLCLTKAAQNNNIPGIVGAGIDGGTMLILYAVSSIYHGLRPNLGKKVMQILDHCAIYFFIAGTYTVILLSAFFPRYPLLATLLLLEQWCLCVLATTFTAVDLKKYNVLSMICYIAMGWSIIFFSSQCITALTKPGFLWLLAGGIVYTIGAILYGIGSKMHWIHSVFHIFVVAGSFLQFISVFAFAL